MPMTRPVPDALPPHLDVAGWLLGALTPDEAAAFEAHLATCADCQAQVNELQPMLSSLGPAEPDVDVPPYLGGRTVSAVKHAARARQRRRWTIGGLVAAALIAVLSLGGIALFGHTTSRPTFDFALSSPNGGPATGTATAQSTGHGWSVHLALHALPAVDQAAIYECWYVDPAQDSPAHPFRMSAGTFVPAASGVTTVQMWSAADPRKFPVMQITVEPNNGNPASTGTVVLTGTAHPH
jgi:anti-sigma-K factor RskA